FEHLRLRGNERVEQLACLLRSSLALASGADRSSLLFRVVTKVGEIFCAGWLLLRRGPELCVRAAGKKRGDAYDWEGPAQAHEIYPLYRAHYNSLSGPYRLITTRMRREGGENAGRISRSLARTYKTRPSSCDN